MLCFFYIFLKFAHNISMIYVFSAISGMINGLFASGAGQILVFYLVFIQKAETHKARATSLFCTAIATIVSIIRYLNVIKADYKILLIAAFSGIIMGFLGSKLMNKIESNKLNLLSGAVITFFAIYNLISSR